MTFGQSWKKYLTFAPAVVTLFVVGGLIVRGIRSANAITSEYRSVARQAVASQDLEKAKFYYTRLVGAGDQGSDQDQLNWVSILDASGDVQAAQDLLDKLAPNDAIGFEAAHLEKARHLSALQSRPPGLNSGQLENLAWHLRHGARVASVETDLLWANYYLAVEQIDKAIDRFESASDRKPDLWFDVASLYKRLQRPDDAKRAMARAENHAWTQLEANPLDVRQRVRLLMILADLEEFDQVQAVLSEGLRLNKGDKALQATASDLTLVRLAMIQGDGEEAMRQRLSLLALAAQLNPNNPKVYAALSSFYQMSDSASKKSLFREQLESWIANGESVVHAHFALGNVLWQESDPDGAIFHFETAMELDPQMTIVANNLAWVLCQTEEPDFVRAEKLINLALESNPGNASFHDTMGLVLFKQQKYREALPYMEKVLPNARDAKKRDLHDHLATIYENLGQTKLAERHREQGTPPES